MITRRSALTALAAASAAGPALAQAPALHRGLTPVRRFLGRWRGDGEGQPGVSTVERSYEPALGGRFLMARHTSRYARQPKNPKGEVHEDLGFFSFDSAAKAIVFRQFHTEGFVNHYVALAAALSGDVLVLETTAIENIPVGFKARETFTFKGPDAFEELFEIAEPGKAYTTYSINRFRRA
jgi:hypothetical protein